MDDKAENKRISIKNWAEDDRPREKLLTKGVGALSDAEIIAILISSGNKNESAVELSRRILHDSQGNLNELARLSVKELSAYNGIGEAKAISIVAALELGKRRKMSDFLVKKQVTCSKDIYEIFHPLMIDLKQEEFWVLLMNNSNRVVGKSRLTQGGARQTVVDIPMLLRMAIEKAAYAVAVAHNHPSGQCSPSREDENITRKIADGCKAIDIRFLDHLVITQDSYYSFADEGNITW